MQASVDATANGVSTLSESLYRDGELHWIIRVLRRQGLAPIV